MITGYFLLISICLFMKNYIFFLIFLPHILFFIINEKDIKQQIKIIYR